MNARDASIPEMCASTPGWFMTSAHDDRLIWKDGGVLGYSSFIGYSASHGNGLVVLANGNSGVLNLGKHLLNRAFPLQG